MDSLPAFEQRNGLAAELASALPGRVHVAGEPQFRDSLARVFFPEAARRSPSCVVTPADVADVATTLTRAAAAGVPVTVRGGGLSSNCVRDDAVLLDLSVHFATARTDGDSHVVVGGGATVGEALAATTPTGRVIPVGIAGIAGLGLITRGGVGYLTRDLGLTLDQIVELEMVLPDGTWLRLSEDSRGVEEELWWAARGCAPSFGVVTSARLRTHPQGPVYVERAVVGLDALATYFATAPQLPRHTTMGAVLGWGGGPDPVLLVYTACRSSCDDDVDVARSATSAVVAASKNTFFRAETSGRYLAGLPEFAIPGPGGAEPAAIAPPDPTSTAHRGWFYGKSVFTGPNLGADIADGLAAAITAAPTRACRIDFQHTGGALADVEDTATAFWGRRGEWNVPLNAIWSDAADTDACRAWARDTLAVLAPGTIGGYSVELRSGFAESAAEIDAAYGGNLRKLRDLRDRIDPGGVLLNHPLAQELP
ncbi:FAD-binding oxidoreductase [Gordonia sp. TBRC 11910]|uniref:FAD-binding oxidoreductase n=1 Tax=Gordonia asplenii TaxID=2725283 RepID=A0A848L2E0_9ACTN|nr:FAD-binding protein [Gordonia asplenii]NMO05014.1 FAD-binding oxidoreductase [Gordonia asplenii]